VELTPEGDRLVTKLAGRHLAELHDLAATLHNLIPDVETPQAPELPMSQSAVPMGEKA
jgi:hypothetical protein